MKNPCIDCGKHYPGLGYILPDDVWRLIAPNGNLDDGELCPWCADRRLGYLDHHVQMPPVHLDLGHFHAVSREVLKGQEALARRMHSLTKAG